MTRLRIVIGVLAATSIVLVGCRLLEPPPGYAVDIFGNHWSIESAGSGPLTAEYILEFSKDEFTVSSQCGTIAGSHVMDTDGAALYFYDMHQSTVVCPVEIEMLVATLSGVEQWSVESDDVIHFHGETDVTLGRVNP